MLCVCQRTLPDKGTSRLRPYLGSSILLKVTPRLLSPSLGIIPGWKNIRDVFWSVFRQLLYNQFHEFLVDDLIAFGVKMQPIVQQAYKRLVLLNLAGARQGLALLPACLLHESGPDVENREVELLSELTNCFCVLGRV